ncbi:fibronectin type III domain-containing protein [Candidatus Roizmanbacteria bacterium]|nr:fibronectin type III domain-containing protein [Candidatus Roizmanbacteria bacterium]
MKKIIVLSLLLVPLLFIVAGVKAADYNLTCTYSAGCSPSLPAFFPSSEVWYPGKTLTKTVQFTNNSSIDRKVGVQSSQTLTSGDVDQVIDLIITKSDSTVLFSNSLHAFYASGEVLLLDNLASHASETFSFQATMYSTSGNEYQSMTTQFDLIIGLISSPTPTPPACTDTAPATPGSVTLSRVNDAEVKATWGTATDPVTGYRVSWSKDTDTDGDGEGTRSVGKTTETNITGLNLTSYTHYFKVRAVNGCKEGATTGIATIGDGKNYLAPTSTPAPTPTSTPLPIPSPIPTTEVLGVSTSSGTQGLNNKGSQKEVKGVTTSKCIAYWWQILLLQSLLLALYYFRFAKNMNSRNMLLTGLGALLGGLAVFRIMNSCHSFNFLLFPKSPSPFMKYFVLLDIAVILAILLAKKWWTREDSNL